MKGSILQLLVFLLLFIASILGIGVSAYLLWFDAEVLPVSGDIGSFLSLLPSFLFYVLPLSVLGSILFSRFVTLKRQANGFLSWLLIFAAGTGIYYFGFSGFIPLGAGRSAANGPSIVQLYGGTINPFPEGYVYVGSMDASAAYSVVREYPRQFPSLRYTKRMSLKDLKRDLSVPVQGTVYEKRLAGNPYYTAVFSMPPFISSLLADMHTFTVKMGNLYTRSRYFLLFAVAAQVFFALSCWSLLKIFPWPLINAFFSLVLIRGIFALFTFWGSDAVQSRLGFIKAGLVKDNLFSLLLLVFAVLLILFNGIVLLSGHSTRGAENE